MLWWRPEHGALYGYADGWAVDGAFYFTGTGQFGDQRFGAPNAENGRVRDHRRNGDRLRLLRYISKNQVRYAGELMLDSEDPWQWRDGIDALGRTRRMVQFRMLAVGDVDKDGSGMLQEVKTVASEEAPVNVPSEPHKTDLEALKKQEFQRLLKIQQQVGRRDELRLVHAFSDWLKTAHGIGSTGLVIPVGRGLPPLRADLWIPSPAVLVEAKASAAREYIRMAVGQLFDYARYLPGAPAKCVLLPHRPSPDMATLLGDLSIASAWADERGFVLRPSNLLRGAKGGLP